MEFWQKAKSFAEETAKRSQEAAKGINSAKISDMVSEASKRSKEIAAEASKRSKEIATEASKRADQIKVEAMKRADQIKSQIPVSASALSQLVESSSSSADQDLTEEELVRFGVTEELREFVKGITIHTFKDFPLPDDSDMSDIPTVSNVRQDLSQWQEKHAKYVLLSVKEISKLRYELCPRMMKERKFWRIYFMLVNSHLESYEKRFMEEEKQKSAEKVPDNVAKETLPEGSTTKTTAVANAQKSNSGTSLASEQDLDVFLLGDTGDSDGPDDGDEAFDDDFDKL